MLPMLALLFQECLFFLGYVTGQSQFPTQLSREEEQTLAQRMLDGDASARDSLIEHKYTVPGYGADDLISIGVIGLVKAVNSYKPSTGAALGTYAARCIENEIRMTLRASRKRKGDVSLSDPIGTDGEGNDITYQDILCADGELPEDEVIRRVTLGRVHDVLCRLPARERMVLEMRYGLIDGIRHPQHEIARLLGISRSYVSRVEKKAVTLLRNEIGEE